MVQIKQLTAMGLVKKTSHFEGDDEDKVSQSLMLRRLYRPKDDAAILRAQIVAGTTYLLRKLLEYAPDHRMVVRDMYRMVGITKYERKVLSALFSNSSVDQVSGNCRVSFTFKADLQNYGLRRFVINSAPEDKTQSKKAQVCLELQRTPFSYQGYRRKLEQSSEQPMAVATVETPVGAQIMRIIESSASFGASLADLCTNVGLPVKTCQRTVEEMTTRMISFLLCYLSKNVLALVVLSESQAARNGCRSRCEHDQMLVQK